MVQITKLEKLGLLLVILFCYLNWDFLLYRYPFIKLFDFCMAAFFWSFVYCYDREDKLHYDKMLKTYKKKVINDKIFTLYDLLIVFVMLSIKFINDFYLF